MLTGIRTLLLVTAIAGVMALLSPVAHAEITITRAEVQWGAAVVMGRDAAANDTIYWKYEDETEPALFTASKRGKFSFRGVVPSDCEGALSTYAYPAPKPVTLSNCTPASGEPDDPDDPDDPPGADPELPLYRERTNAHDGDAVRAVGFIVDGEDSWIISGGDDATLRTWALPDPPDLEELEEPEDLLPQSYKLLDHPIYDFETSDDGSIVATGEGDWNGGPGSDTFRIWPAKELLDRDTDPVFIGTTAPIGFVYCVAISPSDPGIDFKWTVASGFYGEIVVYETSSTLDEPLVIKKTKKKRTKALAFSPAGNILASTSTAGKIQLWRFPKSDCDSGSCELELLRVSLSHGGSWVFPIAIAPYSTPNEIEIVSGSDGGMIKVWTIDVTDPPSVISSLPVSSGAVYSLAWSPDGSMIVAGGNGDLTVYDALDLDILFQNTNAHVGRVNDVAFSPYGSFIVSGGADGALKLWALDLGAP